MGLSFKFYITLVIFLLWSVNSDFVNALKCYKCDEIREGIYLSGNCSVEASEKMDCYVEEIDMQCIYLTMNCKFTTISLF